MRIGPRIAHNVTAREPGRHWNHICVLLPAVAVLQIMAGPSFGQCTCPHDIRMEWQWDLGADGPNWSCECSNGEVSTVEASVNKHGAADCVIIAEAQHPGGCEHLGPSGARGGVIEMDCDHVGTEPESCNGGSTHCDAIHNQCGPCDPDPCVFCVTNRVINRSDELLVFEADPPDQVGTATEHPERPVRVVINGAEVLPGSYIAMAADVSAVGPLPEGLSRVRLTFTVSATYSEGCCLSCCKELGSAGCDASTYELTCGGSVTVVSPSSGGDESCQSGQCGRPFGARLSARMDGEAKRVAAGAARFSTSDNGFRGGDARVIVQGDTDTELEIDIPPRLPILMSSTGNINRDYSVTTWSTHSPVVTDNVTDDEYEFHGGGIGPGGESVAVPGDQLALTKRRRYDSSGTLQEYVRSSWNGGTVEYTYDVNMPEATIWYQYEVHNDGPSWNELTKVKVGDPVGEAEDVLDLGYTSAGRLTHVAGSCGSCGVGYYDYAYDDRGHLTLTTEGANHTTIQRSYYDYGMAVPVVTKVSAGPAPGGLDRWRYDYSYDYNGETYNELALTKYTCESNGVSRVAIEEYASGAMGSPTRVYVYRDVSTPSSPLDLSTAVRYRTDFKYSADDGAKSCTITPRGLTHASYTDISNGDPSYGHVTKETMEYGGVATIVAEYNYGNVSYGSFSVAHRTSSTDARQGETDYEYASKGLLTKRVDPDGGSGRVTYQYRYDPRQLLTREWHEPSTTADITRAYEYDNADNLTKVIEALDSSSPSGATTSYEYSMRNFQTKVTDPRGFVQTKWYSASGALFGEAAFASGSGGSVLSQSAYDYDENGRMTQKRVANDVGAFSLNSPAGWVTARYAYDDYGRQTAVIADAGAGRLNLTTSYEYNNQDEVAKTTTPGGVWTETQRDGRGLVIKQIMGYDTDTNHQLTTSYEYDEDGNLTRTAPPSGPATVYQYDGFDRRTKTIRG